ncbi:MAG: HD domain-containing protein [bacterium]|nr:HD domain-containing protein [bacterium]
MNDEERLKRALNFAAEKHSGQFRIGGDEYITHPMAVAEILRKNGYEADYQIAALFHDLLEDTDASEEEIRSYGNERILNAVKLLTKETGYKMSEYIERIRNDEMAFAVKAADRLHNLRTAIEADEHFRRKYILETREWYMDFSPQISEAVKKLEESLEEGKF